MTPTLNNNVIMITWQISGSEVFLCTMFSGIAFWAKLLSCVLWRAPCNRTVLYCLRYICEDAAYASSTVHTFLKYE